jgi:hypothetical protein
MKPCTQCKIVKPLAEYYRDPRTSDRRMYICKACHKERMHIRQRLRFSYIQEYERRRSKTPKRQHSRQATAKAWDKKHPDGYRAHYTARNAVRDGRLKKGPCVLCGATRNVHGHHKNYAEPLNITWLCARCNHRLHSIFPEFGANYIHI